MGQTLSEPVTENESAHCQNDELAVGSSCMQGYRSHMEDSHTHILSLPDDPGTSFFAVYDGHGSANIGKYASKHLHKFITKRAEYQAGDVASAMKKAFLDIDEALLNSEELKHEMGGSTAVITLIKDNKLYCANVGDSRAIACVNGQAIALSVDHKPILPVEMQRIHESGGLVENCRVNSSLALSRAFGDFKSKQNKKLKAERQIVTAYPDVEIHDVDEKWDFILLASDGIWDVLSNDDVVKLCLKKMEKGIPPEQICEEIITESLSPDLLMTGTDNIIIVLICFLHNKTYEDFCKRAAKYYRRGYHHNEGVLRLRGGSDHDNNAGPSNSAQLSSGLLMISESYQNDDSASSNDTAYSEEAERLTSNDQTAARQLHHTMRNAGITTWEAAEIHITENNLTPTDGAKSFLKRLLTNEPVQMQIDNAEQRRNSANAAALLAEQERNNARAVALLAEQERNNARAVALLAEQERNNARAVALQAEQQRISANAEALQAEQRRIRENAAALLAEQERTQAEARVNQTMNETYQKVFKNNKKRLRKKSSMLIRILKKNAHINI